jgi:hypothetical protein
MATLDRTTQHMQHVDGSICFCALCGKPLYFIDDMVEKGVSNEWDGNYEYTELAHRSCANQKVREWFGTDK